MITIDVNDIGYEFLSPNYLCRVSIAASNAGDVNEFISIQHIFQYFKTFDLECREMLMSMKDPADVYNFGQKTLKRHDWHHQKYFLMQRFLKNKFSSPEMKQKLINTGNGIIVMYNKVSDYWGIVDGIGNNVYGKQLMELRSTLIKIQMDSLSYSG